MELRMKQAAKRQPITLTLAILLAVTLSLPIGASQALAAENTGKVAPVPIAIDLTPSSIECMTVAKAKYTVKKYTKNGHVKYIQFKGKKFVAVNNKMKAYAKKAAQIDKTAVSDGVRENLVDNYYGYFVKPKVTFNKSNVVSVRYQCQIIHGTSCWSLTKGFTTYKGKQYSLPSIIQSSKKSALENKIQNKLYEVNPYFYNKVTAITKARSVYLTNKALHVVFDGQTFDSAQAQQGDISVGKSYLTSKFS
jgi:hypothetical protein